LRAEFVLRERHLQLIKDKRGTGNRQLATGNGQSGKSPEEAQKIAFLL
jgi:hypothetical protein